MMYMARAYPSFKTELEAAIAEGSADEAGKAMLLNIQFMCEFAIPAVFSSSSYMDCYEHRCYDRNDENTPTIHTLITTFDIISKVVA